MPKQRTPERTETDHLEMMRNPNRWPCWPILPVQHATRREPDGSMRLLGFMCEGSLSGKADPRVYVGSMYWKTEGKRFEDLPVEDYPNLEAVVAAGWEVN